MKIPLARHGNDLQADENTTNKAWDDSPYPQILLLRGGTMNTVAKNLKLWGKPRKLLKQAVQRLRAGDGLRTKTRWMLVVNGRLGFWFGNGGTYCCADVHS